MGNDFSFSIKREEEKMKTISFPIIQLQINLNPIAFTIFGIEIYWYALILTGSMILALLLMLKNSEKFHLKKEDLLDLSIGLIPLGLIGARIYYVIFNYQQYTTIWDIFSIKDGGIAIYGAIITAGIYLWYFCKKKKLNIWNIGDFIVPYLALGQSIGRWANFINVEAYGEETNLPWKMGILENGTWNYVHPTFLYESIATFLVFLLLKKISKKRKYEGELTQIYFILYSFVRFFIEGLRIDSLRIFHLRISQLFSLFLFVVFCYMLTKKVEKVKNS